MCNPDKDSASALLQPLKVRPRASQDLEARTGTFEGRCKFKQHENLKLTRFSLKKLSRSSLEVNKWMKGEAPVLVTSTWVDDFRPHLTKDHPGTSKRRLPWLYGHSYNFPSVKRSLTALVIFDQGEY